LNIKQKKKYDLIQKYINKMPLFLIYRHLGILVLGRGSRKDWEIIQQQVDIILDPAWIKKNLPYLTPDDMKDAVSLLGLPMKDGKVLFKAEWFADGHEYAPLLHAKPSEFAAVIDELARRDK